MSYAVTVSPQQRRLRAEQRRALEMLAAAGPHGCAGPTLLGHGFRVGMLADLVGEGLATARRETMRAGKRHVTIARFPVTDAGRPGAKTERPPVAGPARGPMPVC